MYHETFCIQGLFITDIDSFGGMQAMNIIAYAPARRPAALRNCLLRKRLAADINYYHVF